MLCKATVSSSLASFKDPRSKPAILIDGLFHVAWSTPHVLQRPVESSSHGTWCDCNMQEIGGVVFGYDPSTDVVIIKEPGTHGGVVNLRLYKAAQLQVQQQ